MITLTGLKYATAADFVNVLNTALGSGAKLRFLTGSPPGDPSDPETGTLVAECDFDSTPFVYSSAQDFTANPIADDTDTTAGTVGYARAVDSGGTCWIQFTVDDVPGQDFIFDDLTFADHDTLTVDVFNCECLLAP